MKTFIQTVFCLFLVFFVSTANGQTSPCTANTPHFIIDLTGEPAGVANIAPVARQGLCCGAQSPDACIMATITLDSNTSGIRFDIASGAVPPGALYYQIGCNSPTKVGEPICLNGPGPHILTFCKPGNNQNGYSITALPKHIVPDSVFVDVGCSVEIGTLGYFIDSSLSWTDLTSNDGRYLDYLDCYQGCDTVLVTPDHLSPSILQYEVCGTLIDTVCQTASSRMCKTVTVVVNSIRDSVEATICQGEAHLLPDGESVDSAATYVTSLPSASGCDSIIYTFLTVNPTHYLYDSLTQCDSAQIHGNWYYDSQIVVDSFLTTLGCDSVIETALTIHKFAETFLSMTNCDSAQVNGNWYYNSQLVVDLFSTVRGCDSLVYTDLTINMHQESFVSEAHCDSAQVNTNWYYTSQVVVDSFLTSSGCDSIVYTELTINYAVFQDQNLTQCDSAEIHGKWYYDTQTVVDSFKTLSGCDSVITTELTINYSDSTFVEITSCENAMVDGNLYGASTTIINRLNTDKGCDSIVIITLIINYEDDVKELVEACDSTSFNGMTLTNDSVIREKFTNRTGCDSLHTTTINIYRSKELDLSYVKCIGESILLPDGREVTQNGIYESLLQTVHGCDSLIHTKATFNSTYYQPVPDTAKCLGDEISVTAGEGVDIVSYEWSSGEYGQTIQTRDIGSYKVLITARNGCASVDTISVLDANCPACPVYTPTAFTITNDYLNEDFASVSVCDFEEFRFEVYNRWGELIMTTTDPQMKWDGTYRDKPAQQDVYVWLLYYKDKRSLIPIKQSGTVTLLR